MKNQNLIRILLICFVFTSGISTATAQEPEAGILTGVSHYLGDIGGKEKDGRPFLMDLQYFIFHPATGIFYRQHVSDDLHFRVNMIYGHISADDKYSTNYGRQLRNLHFRSDLWEMSAQFEFSLLTINQSYYSNPFSTKSKSRSWMGMKNFEARLYGFAGTGIVHFNPQAQLRGEWYDLQPLGTEGQVDDPKESDRKKKYSRTVVSLPMGLGADLKFNSGLKIGIEIGWRKTFTDYLDDISGNYADPHFIAKQNGEIAAEMSSRTDEISNNPVDLLYSKPGEKRGDPTNMDSYIFTVLTAGYPLDKIFGNDKNYLK